MYEELCDLQESEDISLPTKAHLNRAHLELQVRIQEVQDHLTTFYFDDAHFAQEDMQSSIRTASNRFRKFLVQFYEKVYKSWPIKGRSDSWINRDIVHHLQKDFSALYEYSVDRNVKWHDHVENGDRQRGNLLKSINSSSFGLDAEDHRMLGVFRNIGCRLMAANIPHP